MNHRIDWVDPIVPDEDDRVAYLRYKHENGQLYRKYDILTGTKVTTSYIFQEDVTIDPQVGDEVLRCRVIYLGSDNQQTLYDIVILTQEIIDFTDPIDNVAPTDIALTNNTIIQSSPIGTVVGSLSTYDPNIGDTHTYTITQDLANKFEISGNNLRIKNLMSQTMLHTHLVTVRSTDQGGLFFEKQFSIYVQASLGFVNDKSTLFQGDTINTDMSGPASNVILPGNGSFTLSAWVKKNNPTPFNEIKTSFNGTSQYLSAPYNASFAGLTKISMDAWINLSSISGERVISSHFGAAGARGFRFSVLGGKLYINISENGSTQQSFSGTTTLLTGTNYHVAFSFDGVNNTIKTWINGVIETNTTTTMNSVFAPNIPLRIGARGDSSLPQTAFLGGFIDEVSLHNDALITSDILAKYNSGTALDVTTLSSASSLVSFWRMGDQDIYPTILDNVGSNNMTMQSMTSANFVLLNGNPVPSTNVPQNISGLKVWLDADDETTITQSANAISEWRDKSGNLNHATQPTGANKPTLITNGYGSRKTVGFNTPSFITTPYATGLNTTIITVYKHQHVGAVQPAGPVWQLDPSYTGNGFFPRYTDGKQYVGITGNAWMSKTSELTFDTFYNAAVVYNSTAPSTSLYLNNVLNHTTPTGEDVGTAFTLGKRTSDNLYFKGQVAEVLIYNRVLTPSELATLESYLNTKWVLGINNDAMKPVISLGDISLNFNQKDEFSFLYKNVSTASEITSFNKNYGNNIYNHIAVTYDYLASTVSMIVNNSTVATASAVIPSRNSEISRIAGNQYQSKFLDSIVDEVSIFNTSVSIVDLYNNGKSQDLLDNSNLPSPRLWLRMGDTPDDYLTSEGIQDRSTNSFNFTANNMNNSNCITDPVIADVIYTNTLSLPFNGIDQYGDTGITSYDGTSDFSISVWYKGISPSYIVSQAHTLGSYSSDFIIGGGGAVFWIRSQTLGTLASISDNQWHNLILSWNSITSKYDGYVDGVNIGTSALVSTFGGVGTIAVSTRGDFSTSFNQGNIDELSFWNKALNDTEAAEIYNTGVPTDLNDHSSTVNMINWYRMGDDSGDDENTVVDQKGTDNITLTNFLAGSYDSDVPT